MHKEFKATAISHYYGDGSEFSVSVILSSDKGQPAMRITTDHDYVYITKEQAMAFFNLKEA